MSNISYPYPVLGNSDDVLFDEMPRAEISVEEQHNYYKVMVDIQIDNEAILNLIDKGMAEYVCRYESSATLLRNISVSKRKDFFFLIEKQLVKGPIYFSPMIIAKRDFVYKNNCFHEDYNNESFDMERGDYLAVLPRLRYDADLDFSSLRAVGSFINIRKNDNPNIKEVEFDLESDKIGILLPEDMYQMYVDNTNIRSSAGVLHSSMAMNALVFALAHFQDDNYRETKWARSIDYRIKNEKQFSDVDINDMDILSVANRMMANPYRRLFDELINKNK